MRYLGDFAADSTIRFYFSTEAGGEAAALVGGVVSVYKNGLLAQLTNAVVTASFDGIVGFNLCEIDASNAGYGQGDYQAILSAGTVGGLDVFPRVLDSFSITNRSTASIGTIVTDFEGAADTLLNAIKAKTDLIEAGDITVASPFSPQTGKLTLTRGDDYPLGRLPAFTSSDWPNLTGAVIRFTARKRPLTGQGSDPVILSMLDIVGSRIAGTGSQSIFFTPMSAVNANLAIQDVGSTDDLIPGTNTLKWDMQAVLANGKIYTLIGGVQPADPEAGLMDVIEDETRV